MNYATATIESLSSALKDARSRTIALVDDLDEQQLMGEILPTVNPLRWEIAHAAYFHETWVLRHLGGHPPLNKDSDALFDSIEIAHKDRWDLPLPSMRDTYEYMNEVLEHELELLNKIELNKHAKYFYLLALFHEDMHNEAFLCTRQTLAYPKPAFMIENNAENKIVEIRNEDLDIPGGTFYMGAERNEEFIFDNEKWAHEVHVAPFVIAKYAVSNEQFLEFVEAGGYQNEKFWSSDGWKWLQKNKLAHPIYWNKDSDACWYVRLFDQWQPLNSMHAVSHISWYEAQAFCNWCKRRLPTESEWEFAAACHANEIQTKQVEKTIYPECISLGGGEFVNQHANLDCAVLGTTAVGDFAETDNDFGCRQMFGNVWEWTSSNFEPYPGFSPDWYTEYSRPLFSETKVLRGGAWPTRSRMLRTTLRNYYGPGRNDVFAGFRTCAL